MDYSMWLAGKIPPIFSSSINEAVPLHSQPIGPIKYNPLKFSGIFSPAFGTIRSKHNAIHLEFNECVNELLPVQSQ